MSGGAGVVEGLGLALLGFEVCEALGMCRSAGSKEALHGLREWLHGVWWCFAKA